MSKILSIGSVLWDLLPGGKTIGGAPFNVASHLRRLGHTSAVFTGIGRDALGEETMQCIRAMGLETEFVQVHPTLPTGVANVTFDAQHQPHYDLPHCAYDELCADTQTLAHIQAFSPDAVCFGTYESRGQGTRHAVGAVLDTLKDALFFFDINIRVDFINETVIRRGLSRAQIVKLNDEEAARISPLLFGETLMLDAFSKRLLDVFGMRLVLITCGKTGAYAFEREHTYFEPAFEFQQAPGADSVGAGDAFSAAFLDAYLRGVNTKEALRLACVMGGYVASQPGALPPYSDTLFQAFSHRLS